MTDYDVPTGLHQLADEADPAPIDTYDIIAMAKARTRNRRGSLATAFGTVAVVGALAGTLNFPTADEDGTQVGGQTSTADCPNRGCPLPDPGHPIPSPELAEAFDEQLAAAIDTLIPAGSTLERDPAGTEVPLAFVGTDNGNGPVYSGTGWLRDAQGPTSITVFVLKKPAGAPLEHATGQFFGPCSQGDPNCEITTLQDGTQVTAQANARPPGLQLSSTLTAQRPDGTYIQVINSVGISMQPGDEQTRHEPQMTNADLLRWATVFTWEEPDKSTDTGAAKYDDQLAAAGDLPARYGVEGVGGTGPTKFQEAPDNTDTPRYFLQVNLVPSPGGGESTSFSIFVVKQEDADGDPGKCGDTEDCKEHRQQDGTSVAVWTEVRTDEVTTHMTALRPDGTVIEVQHSGAPGIPLLNEDELRTLATAFTY